MGCVIALGHSVKARCASARVPVISGFGLGIGVTTCIHLDVVDQPCQATSMRSNASRSDLLVIIIQKVSQRMSTIILGELEMTFQASSCGFSDLPLWEQTSKLLHRH